MVQRRTRGAERCSAPRSTSEVQTPELAACQSAPAQAARLAWARRFVVCRLCHGPFHGVFGSWLRLDVLGEEPIVGVECRGLCDGLAELGVAACAQAMPSSCPRLVLVAQVHGCTRCPFGRRLAPPCFVHGQAFQGATEDGAGKSGARLRLDAALEAAEDGHVAGLQVRSASWRYEAQHDVRERGLHGSQSGLAGVDAGRVPEKDPRLSLPAWIEHAVQCGCELQERGRRGQAVLHVVSVLWPGLLQQDGVCLAGVQDLHQHVQSATVHAAGLASRRGGPTRSDLPEGGGRTSRRRSRRGLR